MEVLSEKPIGLKAIVELIIMSSRITIFIKA